MASIRKHGKSWQYTISKRDETGKLIRKSKSGFAKKVDAIEAAVELEKKLNAGLNLFDDITLIDYYQNWLDTYKIGKHTRVTEARYNTIKKQLAAYFGNNKQLKTMTRAEWQQFLNFFGKNHAKETVSKLNSYVRAMAKSAVADRVINFDFTEGAILTGSKGKSDELKFLQLNDFKKLKKYVFENASINKIFNYIIATGILTGARFSEILALTWKDVDFSQQTIQINKSWDYNFTNNFKETKTETSNRTVQIDDDLVKLLKKLKREQLAYLKTIKRPISINEMVFLDKDLKLITNTAINKDLKNIENRLNITPIITFHGLRHTHVSYLLSQGVDINYISHRLGHSNVAITMRVYTHLLKDYEKQEADKAVKVLQML